MEINVHELRLPEKDGDDFPKRFNYVGQLRDRAMDKSLTEEEADLWWKEFSSQKLCLEQGYPMSFITDLTLPHPSMLKP